MNKIKTFTFIFSLLFFLTSCQTLGSLKGEFISSPPVFPEPELCPKEITWKEFEDGFLITSHNIRELGVSWHCVKIDLNNPNLKIYMEPHKTNLGSTFKVKDFAKATKSAVAINTTPFDLAGKTYLPEGIVKYNNEQIWPPKERYCALAFTKTEENLFRAEIINQQSPDVFEDIPFAMGGFFTVLKDNEIIPFAKNKRSRTGCGISDNGRYLYLMVTTPFFHPTDRNGLNYEECALIFRKLGCDNAMQFDGGHSSAMVVNGKPVETPFMQRKVPVAIGFSIK